MNNLATLLPPGPYAIAPEHGRAFLAMLAAAGYEAHFAAWNAAGRPGLATVRRESARSVALKLCGMGVKTKSSDETGKPFAMSGAAAIIPISGVMSKDGSPSFGIDGTANIRRQVQAALSDPTVQQTLIYVDSPGGEVRGNGDLAADVARLANAKPTFAYIEDLGASCAYWVASQCNAVFANAGALVGCIGVIGTLVDSSGAAEQQGLKFDYLTTGAYKATGAEGAPITPEHRAYAQSLVDAAGSQFFGAVKKGRGLTDDELGAVNDGRLFPATQARSLKLIDGVRTLGNTLAELKSYKAA